MPSPFAALEERVSAAIVKSLANETMTIGLTAVDGMFTNETVIVDFVESRKPVFICKSADVQFVSRGSTATTSNAAVYKVRGIQPDGTGMTKLILELQ